MTPPAGGTPTTTLTDARGRTAELRQYTAAAIPDGDYQATTYAYDRLDRLVKVTDPAGNHWDYGFDLRGRLASTVDPDKGSATMTYDNASQMLTSTDSRNLTLAYTYDSLGRKTGAYDTSTSGTQRAGWVYDTIAKGQPTSATRYDAGNAYTTAVTGYDNANRPLGTAVTIPTAETGLAGTYTFAATYTVDGSPATQVLPGVGGLPAETLTYGYTDQGFADTLTGTWTGGSQTYVSWTARYFDGLVYSRYMGGDGGKTARTSYFYDDATRRLEAQQIDTRAAPADWVDRYTTQYGYDDAGNVTAIAGKTAGAWDQTECFSYDKLRRLTDAWTEATWSCAAPQRAGADPYRYHWDHDALGSRTSQVECLASGQVTTAYTLPTTVNAQPHTVPGPTAPAPSPAATPTATTRPAT